VRDTVSGSLSDLRGVPLDGGSHRGRGDCPALWMAGHRVPCGRL
jgi:hypothetical protein